MPNIERKLVFVILLFVFQTQLIGKIMPWRSYEVYQPEISVDYICNPEFEKLQYNHCSSIAYFQDTWVSLWNANTVPKESEPNQLIYMSVSDNAEDWGTPELCFASSERSINPVICKKVQWQPTLTICNDHLWAFWSQLSGENDKRDEYYGCYFSVLDDPKGKWFNRRLTWNNDPDPVFNGKKYRILPMQNPAWTDTGRILVPIIMIGPPSDAAPKDEGLWVAEKRVSVLYSDDNGKTWNVSYGTTCKKRNWAVWEPTVWQQSDGSIAMVCRNGIGGMRKNPGDRPTTSQTLLWAQSFDKGKTWTDMITVPIETVVSRMHVMRQDQFETSNPNFNERFLMVHNDSRYLEPASLQDRDSLSLFFKRGSGFDFTAGIQFSGIDPIVSYPHMWRKDDTLHVSYTQGLGYMGIKIAHITPLPDQNSYYIFPRSLSYPDSARPVVRDKTIYFRGNQSIKYQSPEKLGSDGFSAGVWFRNTVQGVFFDCHSSEGKSVYKWSVTGGRSSVSLPGLVNDLKPEHKWMRYHRWTYLGVTVDNINGTVDFYLDGKKIGHQTYAGKKIAKSDLSHFFIGDSPDSQGIVGDIRFMVVYASLLSDDNHKYLYNRLASEFDKSILLNEKEPDGVPCLWLDPSDKKRLHDDFIFSSAGKGGTVEVCKLDGKQVIRFNGEISAGLDLDHNERLRGDKVEVSFNFLLEKGPENVVCTYSDMEEPVRIVCDKHNALLVFKDHRQNIGVLKDGWNNLIISTEGDLVSATLNNEKRYQVHCKSPATWFYLGQGFRTKQISSDSSFIVDVKSVKSRVTVNE